MTKILTMFSKCLNSSETEEINSSDSKNVEMKVFQILSRLCATLGITPSNQSQRKFPFSQRTLIGFLLFGWTIASHLIYIFYVASAYMEYVECICTATGSFITFVCYIAIISESNTIFAVINRIEGFIETSKKNSLLEISIAQ